MHSSNAGLEAQCDRAVQVTGKVKSARLAVEVVKLQEDVCLVSLLWRSRGSSFASEELSSRFQVSHDSWRAFPLKLPSNQEGALTGIALALIFVVILFECHAI